jgi:ferrochelatase
MQDKTGILLVNLGTPRSASALHVARYLNEFLTDGRVIDVPWAWRQFLVRGLIVPRRFRQSAKTYAKIWTDKGSPLLTYGYEVKDALQNALGKNTIVSLAMRYQEPSIPKALEELEKEELSHLLVLPLFPQYASATTGSVHQKVMDGLRRWHTIPTTTFINGYATHSAYIDAFTAVGASYQVDTYDHVLFSFHGLPQRHVLKADRSGTCLKQTGCCDQLTERNKHCYCAQSYATARAIASKLKLSNYSVSFQSRLGKDPWTEPYTEETIRQLAKAGVKRLLVFAPAFTADCLETIYEIGVEYAHIFKECGGDTLQLVESLNTHPKWISALQTLVNEYSPQTREV